MTRDEMLALAERVSEANGGYDARRLDGDIALALGHVPLWATERYERQPELFGDGGPGLRARTWLAPKYNSSLDDAMKTVPGYHKWFAGRDWAHVWQEDIGGQLPPYGEVATRGRHPAIALVEASLRARAAQLSQEGDNPA